MRRPLKLIALSVALAALLLVLVAGSYLGVRHGLGALGLDDANAKGVGIVVSLILGLLWAVLSVWMFVEGVARFKD